jgi:argininosuccinate synthase
MDGLEMSPVDLISALNEKAGLHAIGVIDHIEDRLVGIKSREVYECPAAICLIEAHKDLEKMVLTRHQLMFKELVDKEWAWLVYTGLWVDPLRRNLDAFIDSTQGVVDGKVRLKLYKGGLRVVGRKAEKSLYEIKLATYDKTSIFKQKAAEGFIDLWGLPSTTAYQLFEK